MPKAAPPPPPAGPAGLKLNGLRDRVIGNPSAMLLVNTGTQSVLRMGSNIVLARLLAPGAFALVAITSLILAGMTMISDIGIAVTALREGAMSREDEHRLWTMQFLRGAGTTIVMLAAAWPVGWIYHDAQLARVVAALALLPLLTGAQSLYPILAMGQRRLLPSTLLEIGSRVTVVVVSILFALVSPTVWSLVVGTVAGAVFTTIGGHAMANYRPRFTVDRGYIASQWRFSRWIQMSSTVFFLGGQIDKLLFPFLYGMTMLGVYGIGASLAVIPTQITQRWSGSVFYPLTTQLLRGDDRARAQLAAVRMTMLLYAAVMTLTVIVVAPVFFTLFYKAQYHDAGKFAQILALGVFFEVAEMSLRHMPIVEGTPQFELLAVVMKLIGFALTAAIVVVLKGNAFYYALAVTVGVIVGHLYILRVCARRGYVRAAPDLVMAALLVGAAIGLYFVPAPPAAPALLMAMLAAIGLVAAAAMLLVYRRRGLPSLSADPAPAVLRDAAEEEMGLRPEPV